MSAHWIDLNISFDMKSNLKILRNAKVRRAQLYYLRNRQGKAARLKEKRFIAS